MTLREKVYRIVTSVPKGKVTTYGDIGRKIGTKGYRAIGQILHTNPDWPRIPCHRVVSRDGSVASNYGMGGADEHKKRLLAEKVEFLKGKVNLQKHRVDVKSL